MRAFGCALCVLVLIGVAAVPARAAFPGRDGLLAVQPYQGPGLLLVNDRGGDQRRVCTDSATCGLFPRNPQWSPDGRELAFDASGVHVIYPDGSCLDCDLGGGTAPAFTADPQLVTLVADGSLLEDSVDGVRQSTILAPPGFGAGPWSSGVWSAQGELAAVRRGRVWVGTPPHLRALGASDAPSWSPDGTRLAIDRRGWVLVLRVRTGRARRLVRGEHPAWSPDGRSIAFVGARHDLEIVAAAGGRPRRVGRVRADGVDWQPRPAGPAPACAALPGSTVLARSADGMLASDGGGGGVTVTGCLTADGRERVLERLGGYELFDDVTAGAVGAGYAAVASEISDHYQDTTGTVVVFDLRTGAQVPGRGGQGFRCTPSGGILCTLHIDQLAVGAGGVSAAHVSGSVPPGTGSAPLNAVTCPSAGLCAAADGYGRLFTSTSPASGAWAVTTLPVVATHLSCPSASLCVGVGGGDAVTSTDPTGGASAWTAAVVEPASNFTSIACPSVALCVATDAAGDVWTSTDPTAGPGGWTSAAVDRDPGLGTMTCPSGSLCLAFDAAGDAITSTDPTGGAAAWQVQPITAAAKPIQSVSCASPSLCFALDSSGGAYVSSDPASAASWSPVPLPGAPSSVDCPSASLCLAVGAQGTLDVSTDPAGGTWTSAQIDGARQLDSIACASSSLCVIGDGAGNLVASSDPAGGPSAWTATLLDGNPCSAETWCTGEVIEASDATGLHVLDTISSPASAGQDKAPPLLTTLNLSGTLLTWDHAGQPESAVLQP